MFDVNIDEESDVESYTEDEYESEREEEVETDEDVEAQLEKEVVLEEQEEMVRSYRVYTCFVSCLNGLGDSKLVLYSSGLQLNSESCSGASIDCF